MIASIAAGPTARSTASTKSSRWWSIATCAPSSRQNATLSAPPATAITRHPAAAASCTAEDGTPPAAPSTSTVSPLRTWPRRWTA
jgi:hypothetical protein